MLLDRRLPQDNGVDEAEDGDIRSDAEIEGEDGCRGKARTLHQTACGVTKVSNKYVKKGVSSAQ